MSFFHFTSTEKGAVKCCLYTSILLIYTSCMKRYLLTLSLRSIFRRMLVGRHGIPLGLMVGAFQIGSAEYLISKSYVKPLRHSLTDRKEVKTLFVALSLGLAILYSFLVGPASAGALIPTLTWWEMHKPFNDSLPLTSYIGRTTDELYPMSLQRSDIDKYCLGDDTWGSQGCPAEGYDVLDDWAWTREKERYRYNVTEGQHYNPTMLSSFSGQAQREIITGLVVVDNSSTAAAMSATLHSSVLALTDAFWHYIGNNVVGKVTKVQRPKLTISQDTPVSIPFVQVQCQTYDFDKVRHGISVRDPYITFETGAMISNFTKGEPNPYSWTRWVVPDKSWNFTHPENETSVRWIDVSEVKGTEGQELRSSLAAVVTVPIRYSWKEQSSLTTPCIIDARWATTDVAFDTADNVVTTGLTDWLDTTNLLAGDVDVKSALSRWKIGDPISLSGDWATALNDLVRDLGDDDFFHGLGFADRLLQEFVLIKTSQDDDDDNDGVRLLNFYPSSGRSTFKDVSNDVAIILATVITDWVSRSTFRDTPFTTVASAPSEDGNVSTINLLEQRSDAFGTAPLSTLEADQTAVVFRVQRHGWGYGLNTDTIWFSIVILLLHVALVLVYFAYSVVFWCRDNKGWTSAAWASVGELVALALQSPPADELRNAGAGIHLSETWMTTLRLREGTADPGCIELVVGNRFGTVVPTENRLQIDKEYA